MSKFEITVERMSELRKIEAINIAAGKIGWAAFICQTPISELWPFIQTIAEKELVKLKRFEPSQYAFRQLKTVLPDKIETIEQAKAFLTALHENGESYNTDDESADNLNLDEETGNRLDELINQVYRLQNTDFDALGFLNDLDGHIMED